MTDPVSFNFTTTLGVVTITADNPAMLNSFWGSVFSQMAQAGIAGEHSSSHGVFTPDPGDGGRQGVGNSSKNDPRFDSPFGELGGGEQGLHALFQGLRLGDPASLPPGSVEGTVGPFIPQGHPGVTVTFDFVI
jgi:hypothetical protein